MQPKILTLSKRLIMAYITKEKIFSKEWFRSYSLVTLGAFIMAAGFVFFINPYQIVPGGVYGISIVVHELTKGVFSFWPEGIPIGFFGLVLNVPLTILGIKILGPRFGIKTVIGFVLTSAFMDGLTMIFGENDPLGLADEILLACVFGAVLIGFGLGLIFKSKATSGGSDIIAMIFAKYTRMPIGQLLVFVDSTIVILGLIVFQDWKIPLYSWLVIFITGKVIDLVLEGVSYERMMFIISEKHDDIKNKILHDLSRGGTMFKGKGMYTDDDRKMIMTLVNRRELVVLKSFISKVDKDAFVVVTETTEVMGEGFKPIEVAAEEAEV